MLAPIAACRIWLLPCAVWIGIVWATGPVAVYAQSGNDPEIADKIRDLSSKDANRRHDAALRLGNLATERKHHAATVTAIPALLVALKDRIESVRRWAAFALGNIHARPDVTVPALAAVLKDTSADGDASKEAAESLGKFGQDAAPAVPALILALKDPRYGIGAQTAETLGKIRVDASSTIPALAAALANDDGSVGSLSYEAAWALRAFGSETQAVLPTLIALLENKKTECRSCVALAIGGIGPGAQTAVPALTAALRDDNLDVQLEAARALAEIGANLSQALPIASRLLLHEDFKLRYRAAEVVSEFGAAAETAVPALTKRLSDESGYVRVYAVNALVRVARALRDAHRTEAIMVLRTAKDTAEKSYDPEVRAGTPFLEDSVNALEEIRPAQQR